MLPWIERHKYCTSYPRSTEILAHPSLVGSKVYFFWSPTEDYCVTVWWIWFVFVDYRISVWRVWRDLLRWKRWKRPMNELISLFHRAFCSSFTRRKQGLFLLITHGRLSCHSQMNLICVCRLSGQCLACQVWSDEVKMSDEATKCRAYFAIGCYFRSQIESVLDKCRVRVGCVSGWCCATMGRVQQTSDERLLSVWWWQSSNVHLAVICSPTDSHH